MADVIEMVVEGGEEVARALKDAGYEIAEKGMRKALRAGAGVTAVAVDAAAPTGDPSDPAYHRPGSEDAPGGLKEALVIVARHDFDGPNYLVGVTNEGFYGRFLELGTAKMAARPWMGPAFRGSSQAAFDETQRVLKGVVRGIRTRK